ncbi:MAG: Nif3-like dinuclear metal center hexameric protein [Chromatiales bacterium]|nr:Nif3-like dinuclear metal center hexameric protein [Chromatiales bacterium]
MIELITLENYCNQILAADTFDDYCPNGVQVEAGAVVSKLMVGVTACQALIDEAAAWGADALLVHHGYFWKGEPQPLRGIKGLRIASLYRQGISLLAYHLPLDAHAEFGNNRQLGNRLGLPQAAASTAGQGLVWTAEFAEPQSPPGVSAKLAKVLGREPLHIGADRPQIRRIGWCTGAAQGYIDQAAALGLDAYISGEVSESTVHQARELDIHYFAAGHHATERYGVEALGRHLAERYQLEWRFCEIENPV